MTAMPKITVAEKINVVELTVRRDNQEFVYTASNIGVDEPVRVATSTGIQPFTLGLQEREV